MTKPPSLAELLARVPTELDVAWGAHGFVAQPRGMEARTFGLSMALLLLSSATITATIRALFGSDVGWDWLGIAIGLPLLLDALVSKDRRLEVKGDQLVLYGLYPRRLSLCEIVDVRLDEPFLILDLAQGRQARLWVHGFSRLGQHWLRRAVQRAVRETHMPPTDDPDDAEAKRALDALRRRSEARRRLPDRD